MELVSVSDRDTDISTQRHRHTLQHALGIATLGVQVLECGSQRLDADAQSYGLEQHVAAEAQSIGAAQG